MPVWLTDVLFQQITHERQVLDLFTATTATSRLPDSGWIVANAITLSRLTEEQHRSQCRIGKTINCIWWSSKRPFCLEDKGTIDNDHDLEEGHWVRLVVLFVIEICPLRH